MSKHRAAVEQSLSLHQAETIIIQYVILGANINNFFVLCQRLEKSRKFLEIKKRSHVRNLLYLKGCNDFFLTPQLVKIVRMLEFPSDFLERCQ